MSFKVGDTVHAESWGEGEVAVIQTDRLYSVFVLFNDGVFRSFTVDGYYCSTKNKVERIKKVKSKKLDINKPLPIVQSLQTTKVFNSEIPEQVQRYLLGDMVAKISYHDATVSIGRADFATLNQLRECAEWLVGELGGKAEWRG